MFSASGGDALSAAPQFDMINKHHDFATALT